MLNKTMNMNILYLYDLPKDLTTSVSISEAIKAKSGYEIAEIPQIRRDANREFYTAFIKIEDPSQFKEISEKVRYFEIAGKKCRALPYDKDFLGVNRANLAHNNVFVKGLDESISSEDLDRIFANYGKIKSLKVALNGKHESKRYGFVCFVNPEEAKKVIDRQSEFTDFQVIPYNPKPRETLRKLFNNIFVKNIPETWDEAKLRQTFSQFGNITSCILRDTSKEGVNSKFGFVCYGKDGDKEHGIKAALEAVQKLDGFVLENGNKLYVREALKKEERQRELAKEVLRYKNSKKRCNLHVKNFPPTTTKEQLEDYFRTYGEIENIKICSKENEGAVYAFVCFKQPDQATAAKQATHTQIFNGKQLQVNFYEIKEQRKIQQEDAKDKADFQNYKKQSPTNFNIDSINKPEMFQLIQTLITYMSNKQGGNRQYGGMKSNRGPYNGGPNNMGGNRNFNNQMGGMPPAPRPQQQPFPGQMVPPQMMMQRPMVPMQGAPMPAAMHNLPPFVIEYNSKGPQLIPAVVQSNPNYKSHVGEFIYEFVEREAGEDLAPKITGMLIDLPINDIRDYLTDYSKIVQKMNEAKGLLSTPQ